MTKTISYTAVVMALLAAVVAFASGTVLAGTLAVLAAALTGYSMVGNARR